jgi:hypothetical protein
MLYSPRSVDIYIILGYEIDPKSRVFKSIDPSTHLVTIVSYPEENYSY